MALLTEATIRITGEVEDYEGHSDEIDDTVENAVIAARNYIAAELGRLGVGPVVVTVEM